MFDRLFGLARAAALTLADYTAEHNAQSGGVPRVYPPISELRELSVRVAVRAIIAPFLPGSLTPITTTSPVSALSPPTPPPRLVR